MSMSSREPAETHGKLLRAWQLAVLRFAVTLDNSDRLNVLALAAEVDRLGRQSTEASLHFFRRTSVEICWAILGQQEDADIVMVRFHNEIEDPRLKRAFAAAVGIAPANAAPLKRRPKPDNDLFRGLPPRKAHA
jgi:hypothetical protein